MGEITKIAWTDHTFNPWIGCQRVSPGCEHCYAEEQAAFRTSWGVKWGPQGNRKVTSDANWHLPKRWNAMAIHEGIRRRVFCASLADVFEDRAELVRPRVRLHDLIIGTPGLDWLLLTKRPQNVRAMWPGTFPMPTNVWLGTTAEDQQRATERVRAIFDIPATVRFLSVEPMLGPITFTGGTLGGVIDWVICGGESGSQARSFDYAWARDLRDQCKAAGVPYFFKQAGSRPMAAGNLLKLGDRKGGSLDEIPNDLRIREFPQ